MRLNKLSRKGSTMIPAVFLLLFILIFGAALVRGVLLSTNFSTQILNKRQAYLLAESSTNYICDTLAGTQTEPLFASIDTLLSGIGVNTTVDTPVKIDGNEIKTQIKLLSRTEAGSKTNEVYKITSVAKKGGISQSVSREMTAERSKGGLGDYSTVGIYKGREKARYNIAGPSITYKGTINGSARFENAEDFICQYFKVNGDLFIRGNISNNGGVDLRYIEVTKNLYIETTSPNIFTPVNLHNVNVTGDIVVHTSGVVSFVENINAANMYVYAKNGINCTNLLNSNINNLYLAPPLEKNAILEAKINGTIHTGEDAGTAVQQRYRPAAIDPPVDIVIDIPTEYDYTIKSDADWNDVEIKFAEKPVYNILVEGAVWKGEITVSGAGAVNIYSDVEANASLYLSEFRVNHDADSTAAVNIVCTKTKVTAIYNEPRYPLEANLIIPNGEINLSNSAVKGVGIAGAYVIGGPGGGDKNFYFDSQAPWYDFGGGLPGIGQKSVKYAYGYYVK